MPFYLWLFLGGLVFLLGSAASQIYRILLTPNFTDPSRPKQTGFAGIAYSFTTAMSPLKKESAYLHYPTYIAGILFHVGTFVSLLFVFLYVLNIAIPKAFAPYISYFFILTASCGVGIFVKRIVQDKMRLTSTPDDYFSSLVVTVFQILSAVALMRPDVIPALIGYAGVLLFYVPISKLRHAIYFFFARLYLGIYYGKRGVWPARKQAV